MARAQAEILEKFCLIVFGYFVYTTQTYLPKDDATTVVWIHLHQLNL